MKALLALVFAFLMPVAAIAADNSQPAVDAASAWLKLIDAGNYAQSWTDASTLMKSRVTQSDWAKQLKPVRESLGSVTSRDFVDAETATSLPGAPDGQYIVIRFHTRFANKADATETITMMMDAGNWKAAGYFIR
ncbi:MAG: DUF4019 domain-containing protein [Alphaproteobacteria bacterium]|nr:DUF4019 domain-containing protein [Alphaproteobacteria bacterium]